MTCRPPRPARTPSGGWPREPVEYTTRSLGFESPINIDADSATWFCELGHGAFHARAAPF